MEHCKRAHVHQVALTELISGSCQIHSSSKYLRGGLAEKKNAIGTTAEGDLVLLLRCSLVPRAPPHPAQRTSEDGLPE